VYQLASEGAFSPRMADNSKPDRIPASCLSGGVGGAGNDAVEAGASKGGAEGAEAEGHVAGAGWG
jgi:hypothetical protein